MHTAHVRKSTGRFFLIALVFGGFILSFGCVFIRSRGEGIAGDQLREVCRALLGIYLPLVTLVVGFYFGERIAHSRAAETVPPGAFWTAVLMVGIWSLLPCALLAWMAVEDAMELLTTLAPYGQCAAVGATAYYFGRAGSDKAPVNDGSGSAPH